MSVRILAVDDETDVADLFRLSLLKSLSDVGICLPVGGRDRRH
jgi:hypothetical protein